MLWELVHQSQANPLIFLLIMMSSGCFDTVSRRPVPSLERRDKVLKVFDRLVRDRLFKFLGAFELLEPPRVSNLSGAEPLLKLPSPEYVLLCRLFLLLWGDTKPLPRRLPVKLSLSSRSLGAALISMFSRIADTSEGVMPMTFT